MSEELRAGITLTISFCVFIFCYICFLFKRKSGEQKFIENAVKNGNYTKAKYVKSEYKRGNFDSDTDAFRYDGFEVTYSYSVRGKSYRKKLFYRSDKYPFEVTVYYKNSNPHKALCRGEVGMAGEQRKGCLITVAATILTVGIVKFLLSKI